MNLDTEKTHETHSLYIENTRGSKNIILKRFLKSLKSIPSIFRNISKYLRNVKAFKYRLKIPFIYRYVLQECSIYVPQNFNFSRNYESVFKQNFEKHTFEPNFGAYFIGKILCSLYSLLNDSY